MTGTIELNTYENKTITFNKARLTDYVVNSWGFSSLNDFLSDYTFDDADYLSQNNFLLNRGNDMKQVAENVKINISGEEVAINIFVNKEGNIVLDGIESVTYEMVNDELILSRGE